MGAIKNNQNAKREITASSFIHIRVKKSDKAIWVRTAQKKGNGKLAPWVIDALNKKSNK